MSDFSFGENVGQISVTELAIQMAESLTQIQLIDVREPEEIAL
jgi:rhodanese-related sulfurtransferase